MTRYLVAVELELEAATVEDAGQVAEWLLSQYADLAEIHTLRLVRAVEANPLLPEREPSP